MSAKTCHAPAAADSTEAYLTPELAQVLEQYLVDLEQGRRPDPEQLVQQYPEWGDRLREYLASVEAVHGSLNRAPSTSLESSTVDSGRQLGDYQIVREIGRGGMGLVYEAVQISLGRRVALKVLPLAIGLDQRQINRFKNEAQAAAQLQHPHIVPVYWVGCEQGVHCYAMQYIEGRSLEQLIQELREAASTPAGAARGPDHWRLVARLGMEAAEALEHAHQSGVVHRDIKPSNLLLDQAGKLWITDFGLARTTADHSLTVPGEVVGTLRYMSPEQLRGQPGLVDQRTDIYSLAATLYELLTLQPAFPAQEQPELMRLIGAAAPLPPRRINREIPVDLETVLLKAMAGPRDERYSTAGELAAEFQRFLEGKPTLARQPTLLERSYRWAQRHTRLVATAAVLAVAALLVTSAVAVTISRQKQQTEQALWEARESFNRAERNFQQARAIVDRFWTRAAGQLADVPGAESLRRELLVEAREYYRGFIQQARHDKALQSDLAAACFRVGEIAEQLADDQEAQSAYEEAYAIWQRAASPNDVQRTADLALCENNLALLKGRHGELQAARSLLARAIERLESIQPGKSAARYERQLATAYNNLGLQWSQDGNTEEAEKCFQQAIRLHRELLTHGNDPQVSSDLAGAYNNLGYLHSKTNSAAAQEAFRQAIELQEQLVERFPTAPRLRRDLALTYNNLGAMANWQGEAENAIDCYQRAIALQEQLVQAAPSVPRYRQELAVTFNNLGFLHSDVGRYDDALSAFERARQQFQQLVDEHPQMLDYHSSLGGVHNNIGMVYERLEKPADAVSAYRLAVEAQRIASEGAPEVQRYREFLDTHFANLGRVQRTVKEIAAAQETQETRRLLHSDKEQAASTQRGTTP